jgi:replicative DNA helicase
MTELSSTEQGIIPPSNLEAEQALLGALMVNNAAFERIVSRLREEHFAEPVHGRIYTAIRKLIERGTKANPITLKAFFDQDEALKSIGGATYLARLAGSVVTIINVKDYADTIIDCWKRREFIAASLQAIETAQNPSVDHDADAIGETLERHLFEMRDASSVGRGPRHISEFGTNAIAATDRAFRRKGQVTGVPTGLVEVDRLTGGLQPSDLIYLAGRPSMGKSALAGTISRFAARAGHPIYLASPEMSGEQVALRHLSIDTRLSSQRMRIGQIELTISTV